VVGRMTATIPTTVRLGSVAEFTSKILTIAAFHQYHGRLVGALDRLVVEKSSQQNNPKQRAVTVWSVVSPTPPPPRIFLHYVLPLDLASKHVTCELDKRNHALWCLVRCVVVALWRSKLGGTMDHHSNNHNTCDNAATGPAITTMCLTIAYTDGTFQSITQDQLVPTMAQAHQAAPSEYQILSALTTTTTKPPILKRNPLLSLDQTIDYIIDFSMEDNNNNNNDQKIDHHRFYDDVSVDDNNDHPSQETEPVTIVILLPRSDEKKYHPFQINNMSFSKPTIIHNGNHMVQLPRCNMMDRHATLITMTQHLAYQNRILPLLTQRSY
jgi:hypothetical protein